MSFVWTEESIVAVRTLWAEGKSASEISEKIGGLSRCAVLGKLHRLGICRDGSAVRGVRKQRRTLASAQRVVYQAEWRRRNREEVRLKRLSGELPPAQRAAPVPRVSLSVPVSKELSIFDLKDATEFSPGTCKWPHGAAAPFTFCGHDTRSSVYCKYHKAVSSRRGTQADFDSIASKAMGGITGEAKSVVMEA